MKTLYEVLGVCPDASVGALQTAYRKLAMAHHPDLNPGDPDAARRFRQISIAIRVLRDAKRRAAYDQRLARERRRRGDRKGKQHHLEWSRLVTTGISAAAMMSLVLAIEPSLVQSISVRSARPPSGVASGMADIAVRAPAQGSTERQESISRESFDGASHLAEGGPRLRLALDRRDEELARPELHCTHETRNLTPFGMGLGCEPPNDHEVDGQAGANQRAALIRQAQELLATGDPNSARKLAQRACRNVRSRCGLGRHEDL